MSAVPSDVNPCRHHSAVLIRMSSPCFTAIWTFSNKSCNIGEGFPLPDQHPVRPMVKTQGEMLCYSS